MRMLDNDLMPLLFMMQFSFHQTGNGYFGNILWFYYVRAHHFLNSHFSCDIRLVGRNLEPMVSSTSKVKSIGKAGACCIFNRTDSKILQSLICSLHPFNSISVSNALLVHERNSSVYSAAV